MESVSLNKDRLPPGRGRLAARDGLFCVSFFSDTGFMPVLPGFVQYVLTAYVSTAFVIVNGTAVKLFKYFFHIIIILFFLLLMSNVIAAEIYKWTDENGKVHFSDKPLNKNTKKYHSNKSVIGQETFNKGNHKNKKKNSSTKNTTHNEISVYNQQQSEKKQRYCLEAKDDLKLTKNSQLLYNYDKNGKRYFLNEKQRSTVIVKKENLVTKWCK